MSFDHRQDSAAEPLVSRPHRVSPPLMLAGVAGACLLGAGLGLWARPSTVERDIGSGQRPAAEIPASPPRQIEIRVDHPPAPLAPGVTAAAPARVVPRAPAPTELLAPKPPPAGLMRVHAVAPERLAEATRRAEFERKADAAREARAEAKAAAARHARRESARVAAAEARAQDKAERIRAERIRAERIRAERFAARKTTERRLAEQRAAARKLTLIAEAKAARSTKAAAATRLADAKAARTANAVAARRFESRPERVVQVKVVAPRPARPLRLAQSAPRCASSDPGAALTCADPSLGAADRQLSRAYRQAQAAGVSSERLERQQQRWLTARANAARQAPWAVHDIYLARIAELQDQTREASHGD
jgi:hypothetical protein